MDKPSAAIMLGGIRKIKTEFGDSIFDYGIIDCNSILELLIKSNAKRSTNKYSIDALISASTLVYALNMWRRNKKNI